VLPLLSVPVTAGPGGRVALAVEVGVPALAVGCCAFQNRSSLLAFRRGLAPALQWAQTRVECLCGPQLGCALCSRGAGVRSF
jgi:hypothetical protein